jgi:hypothetical protein
VPGKSRTKQKQKKNSFPFSEPSIPLGFDRAMKIMLKVFFYFFGFFVFLPPFFLRLSLDISVAFRISFAISLVYVTQSWWWLVGVRDSWWRHLLNIK